MAYPRFVDLHIMHARASDEGFAGFVLQIHRFYRLRADSLFPDTASEHLHQQTADYFRES